MASRDITGVICLKAQYSATSVCLFPKTLFSITFLFQSKAPWRGDSSSLACSMKNRGNQRLLVVTSNVVFRVFNISFPLNDDIPSRSHVVGFIPLGKDRSTEDVFGLTLLNHAESGSYLLYQSCLDFCQQEWTVSTPAIRLVRSELMSISCSRNSHFFLKHHEQQTHNIFRHSVYELGFEPNRKECTVKRFFDFESEHSLFEWSMDSSFLFAYLEREKLFLRDLNTNTNHLLDIPGLRNHSYTVASVSYLSAGHNGRLRLLFVSDAD